MRGEGGFVGRASKKRASWGLSYGPDSLLLLLLFFWGPTSKTPFGGRRRSTEPERRRERHPQREREATTGEERELMAVMVVLLLLLLQCVSCANVPRACSYVETYAKSCPVAYLHDACPADSSRAQGKSGLGGRSKKTKSSNINVCVVPFLSSV